MTFIQWARKYTPQNIFILATLVGGNGRGGVVDAHTGDFVSRRQVRGWNEWEAFFLGDWRSL